MTKPRPRLAILPDASFGLRQWLLTGEVNHWYFRQVMMNTPLETIWREHADNVVADFVGDGLVRVLGCGGDGMRQVRASVSVALVSHSMNLISASRGFGTSMKDICLSSKVRLGIFDN